MAALKIQSDRLTLISSIRPDFVLRITRQLSIKPNPSVISSPSVRILVLISVPLSLSRAAFRVFAHFVRRIVLSPTCGSLLCFYTPTTDNYQDDTGQWQNKETIWHNILAFNPRVIEQIKALKSDTRVQITGSLWYRPFEVVNGEGEVITKKEASIVARKVELAPLVKKSQKLVESV